VKVICSPSGDQSGLFSSNPEFSAVGENEPTPSAPTTTMVPSGCRTHAASAGSNGATWTDDSVVSTTGTVVGADDVEADVRTPDVAESSLPEHALIRTSEATRTETAFIIEHLAV
jgi:hypothetical protein